MWVGGGVLETHSTQLNSLRPESAAYLSALVLLLDYVGRYGTVIVENVGHVVDNMYLV